MAKQRKGTIRVNAWLKGFQSPLTLEVDVEDLEDLTDPDEDNPAAEMIQCRQIVGPQNAQTAHKAWIKASEIIAIVRVKKVKDDDAEEEDI
jgi:hypothetical protein